MSLNDSLDPDLRRLLGVIGSAVPGAYLVGGAVRDLVTGRQPADLDLAVRGSAAAAADALAKAIGGTRFCLDEERDTWHVTAGALEIDLTSVTDIESDLKRRDFTIDAMAAALLPGGKLGEVIDVTGGIADLEARRLRMVIVEALRDDPLRLLRGVRLAVELELTLDDTTAAAIRELAASVTEAAPERLRAELLRIFDTPRAVAGIRLADELGLLIQLLPELEPARGVDQPEAHHYWDVFDHLVETVAALDEILAAEAPPSQRPWLRDDLREALAFFKFDAYLDERGGGASRRSLLKFAGLLHDVAKPETKTLEADGRTRFFGHPERGAETARRICTRLRFGNRESEFISLLVEEHLRPTMLSSGDLPSKRALYRFFRDLGEAAPACLILSLADTAAAQGPRLQRQRWAGHAAYIGYVIYEGLTQAETVRSSPRIVNGEDLMRELRLAPGPEIGRLTRAIDEAAATGEITTRRQALDLAGRLLAEEKQP